MREPLVNEILSVIRAMGKATDPSRLDQLDTQLTDLYDKATAEEIAEANRRTVILKY